MAGRLTRAEADELVTQLRELFFERERLVHKAQSAVAFAQNGRDQIEEQETDEWAEAEDRLVNAKELLTAATESLQAVARDLEGAYQDLYMAVRQ